MGKQNAAFEDKNGILFAIKRNEVGSGEMAQPLRALTPQFHSQHLHNGLQLQLS